jgi:murein DD-endopeptidase MepM/ murein hydrolase activator NlpD
MSYIPPTTEGWTSQKFGTNPGGYNPAGGHTGEDIAVPVGTPLVAMADGVVVHVGYFSGTYTDNPWWIMPSFAGFVVSVDYGDYLSHYAHCSGSPVLSGRRVKQGDVVAYSGNTGSATSGPHCHWEVMRDGWNLQNSTYGRIDPRTITGSQIAAQGDIKAQEDTMNPEQWKFVQAVLTSLSDNVATKKDLKDTEKSVNWSTQQQVEAVGRVTQQLIIDNASPADIAASIPAGIAQQVADELAKRLVK